MTKKRLRIKIKSYGYKITGFHNKEIPIRLTDSNHTCLSVIRFDSALNKDGNYHP